MSSLQLNGINMTLFLVGMSLNVGSYNVVLKVTLI